MQRVLEVVGHVVLAGQLLCPGGVQKRRVRHIAFQVGVADFKIGVHLPVDVADFSVFLQSRREAQHRYVVVPRCRINKALLQTHIGELVPLVVAVYVVQGLLRGCHSLFVVSLLEVYFGHIGVVEGYAGVVFATLVDLQGLLEILQGLVVEGPFGIYHTYVVEDTRVAGIENRVCAGFESLHIVVQGDIAHTLLVVEDADADVRAYEVTGVGY